MPARSSPPPKSDAEEERASWCDKAVEAMGEIAKSSQTDQPDHRRHRRDRVPDQSARPERRRRGGAGRRRRPGLCGRRLGSARAGAALGGSGQGDQGPDLRPRRRRSSQGVEAGGARPASRSSGSWRRWPRSTRSSPRSPPARRSNRPASTQVNTRDQPDGSGDAAERGDGRGIDRGEPLDGAGGRATRRSDRAIPAARSGGRRARRKRGRRRPPRAEFSEGRQARAIRLNWRCSGDRRNRRGAGRPARQLTPVRAPALPNWRAPIHARRAFH